MPVAPTNRPETELAANEFSNRTRRQQADRLCRMPKHEFGRNLSYRWGSACGTHEVANGFQDLTLEIEAAVGDRLAAVFRSQSPNCCSGFVVVHHSKKRTEHLVDPWLDGLIRRERSETGAVESKAKEQELIA